MRQPCPMCGGTIVSLETPPGDTHARVTCISCGVHGPTVGNSDARPWDSAAYDEWDAWALGRRMLAKAQDLNLKSA